MHARDDEPDRLPEVSRRGPIADNGGMPVRTSLWVVIALAAALARPAHAQAPGQTTSQPATAAPAASPAGVMASRWAIDLALGGWSLRPKGASEGTGFGALGLAGRFRLRPAMELALGLALGGGSRDGVDLSMGALYGEFRYRFRAERPWNVFVLGGLGVASVARKSGSDAERKGRGMLRLGGGVERRFGSFALEATLAGIAVAEDPDVPATGAPDLGDAFARYGVSGIALMLGATYYL